MWRVLCCVGLLFTTVNAAGLGEGCSVTEDCDVAGLGDFECVRVYGSCEPTCQCSDNSYESTVDNTCQLVHGCEVAGECANTLVGSECDAGTFACECGDEIVPREYHGTDYCQLPLIGQSCEDFAENCLAILIDSDSAVCDTEGAGLCACKAGWMQDPDPEYENVACIKHPLDAACTVGETVCIDHASCSEDDSICVCDDGFEPIDMICQHMGVTSGVKYP